MAYRASRLSQDQNLGFYIDGKGRFKGQKKTEGVGMRKPNGKASFRGQKMSGGARVREPTVDVTNSGEPPIINQLGEKKAQEGPLTSGKQLKSNELANLKEEAVPGKEKDVDISFVEEMDDDVQYVRFANYISLFKSKDSRSLFNFNADDLFDSD